jgi:hypothetical protein
MNTNKDSIAFDFSVEDRKIFNDEQREDWDQIESSYEDLKKLCQTKIDIPITGSHKEWIAARVNLHVTPSIMRLLYLTESFCDATAEFNSVTSAVLIKAMAEIPLHLGYLVWILDSKKDFESIRVELSKIAFGNRNPKTGLTVSSNISQKTLYSRSDEMIKKFFKDQTSEINILEELYKDANATGHHNYEGRNMLCGLQNNGTWLAKDRKELFLFYSKNIFHFFMYCETILSMSKIFLSAIDFYLKELPDNFPTKQQ